MTLPFRKSRFIWAITSSLISFGQAASHSPMLVRKPTTSQLTYAGNLSTFMPRKKETPTGFASAQR